MKLLKLFKFKDNDTKRAFKEESKKKGITEKKSLFSGN